MTVKEQLFAKLNELGHLLATAKCDGQAIAEGDLVFSELMGIVGELEQAVEYYVD